MAHSYNTMDEEEDTGRWADLPPEIVQGIADVHFKPAARCSNSPYQIAQMRLVCRSWARAIHINGIYGDVRIHRWVKEINDDGYAQSIIAARITAPALTAGSGSILYTAAVACSNLRSLRLDSVRHEALFDLKHLSNTLEKLKARVLWPKLPEGYLLDRPTWLGFFTWTTCLDKIRYLEIQPLNNPTYIGIKEIVECLPTKHLAHLQLSQCVAPSDLKAADFTHFNKLQFLSVRECHFKTSEIRELQKILPYLYGIECIQHKARDAHRLLQGNQEPSNKATCGLSHLHLCLNFSTEESAKFEELRRNQTTKSLPLSPKLKSIFISFSGNPSCVLSLYYPFVSSCTPPPNLDSLTLQSSLASVENVAYDGQLRSLRSLILKPHHALKGFQYLPPIDCRYLPGLSTMRQLTELDLSFQTIEENFRESVPNILGVMKKLKRLRLDSLKGSTCMLGPVVEMDDLCSLQLHNCTFHDLWLLKVILKSRSASLHELEYSSKDCPGCASCIFNVIADAVPEMARLKKLHIHEQTAHSLCTDEGCSELSALNALPQALAKCTGLTDVRVSPVCNQHDVSLYFLPNWIDLSALTKLCNLSIDTRSGWNLDSCSAICCSLIYLQELRIADYKDLDKTIVDVNWLIEVARLPLLKDLLLRGCRLLNLPLDLKPLVKAPSLMFVSLMGKGIQHPYAMAGRVEEILPNIQKCNVVQ